MPTTSHVKAFRARFRVYFFSILTHQGRRLGATFGISIAVRVFKLRKIPTKPKDQRVNQILGVHVKSTATANHNWQDHRLRATFTPVFEFFGRRSKTVNDIGVVYLEAIEALDQIKTIPFQQIFVPDIKDFLKNVIFRHFYPEQLRTNTRYNIGPLGTSAGYFQIKRFSTISTHYHILYNAIT